MSKEDRFALLNTLSFNDKFFDNENEEYLDSLDVVRILNHYDKTLSEFVKREVEKQDKITDLEAKLAESEIRSKESEIFYKREINRRDTKLRNIKQQLAEMTEKYNACQEARKLEIEFNQQDKAELKQQLAEKDEEIDNWRYMYEGVMQSCHNSIEEEKRLEKLITEKDKELTRLMKNWKISRNQQRCLYYKLLEKQEQEKISFAVEQISRVKEMLYPQLCFDYSLYLRVMAELDNQIKLLKEGK